MITFLLICGGVAILALLAVVLFLCAAGIMILLNTAKEAYDEFKKPDRVCSMRSEIIRIDDRITDLNAKLREAEVRANKL